MGKDVFGHEKIYQSWRQDFINSKGKINPLYLEDGLTKKNTALFLQYIIDMEQGLNVSKLSRKGGRSLKTLNRLRSKIKSIFVGLQEMGVEDVSKITPEQVNKYFKRWKDQGHSNDYAARFKAFWNWWVTKNRRQGKLIPNITEDLDASKGNNSSFVWINKEEFEEYRKYFDDEKQLILLFCFDTIIRSPGELSGLTVGDIYQNNKGEVWVNIPDEISKTFGRKFNLVYCGDQILKHIEGKNPTDPLFNYSSPVFNKQMQKIAKQVFGDKKSLGGEYFKNITLYDLRHSGAINFRQLFQKTGQSLDSLRHRGGWTNFDMINYYTQLLGLDGHIEKEKMLLQEDKTNIEKEIFKIKEENKYFALWIKILTDRFSGRITQKEADLKMKALNRVIKEIS